MLLTEGKVKVVRQIIHKYTVRNLKKVFDHQMWSKRMLFEDDKGLVLLFCTAYNLRDFRPYCWIGTMGCKLFKLPLHRKKGQTVYKTAVKSDEQKYRGGAKEIKIRERAMDLIYEKKDVKIHCKC